MQGSQSKRGIMPTHEMRRAHGRDRVSRCSTVCFERLTWPRMLSHPGQASAPRVLPERTVRARFSSKVPSALPTCCRRYLPTLLSLWTRGENRDRDGPVRDRRAAGLFRLLCVSHATPTPLLVGGENVPLAARCATPLEHSREQTADCRES